MSFNDNLAKKINDRAHKNGKSANVTPEQARVGAYAATGALVGSAIPVVGTAIGGIIGGIIGLASGSKK
jgi:phage tail tape-measure protein